MPTAAPSVASPAAGVAPGSFARIDDHEHMPEEDENEDYGEGEDYFDEEDEEEDEAYDADKALGRAMAEVDDQDWGDLHGGRLHVLLWISNGRGSC